MKKIPLAITILKAGLTGAAKEIWKLYLIFLYAAIAGLGLYIGGSAAHSMLLRLTGQ